MKECCKTYLNDQFGGDEEVIAEIYGEYVSSLADKLAEAESALAAGDWTLLDRVAHTVKGNALSTGDQAMADAAIELRKAATLKDAEEGARLVAALNAAGVNIITV